MGFSWKGNGPERNGIREGEDGRRGQRHEKDGVLYMGAAASSSRRGFGRPEPDGRTREPTRRNIGNGSVPRAVAGCLSLPQDGWRGKKEEERSWC
jgi:hypothetical protein